MQNKEAKQNEDNMEKERETLEEEKEGSSL